MLDFDGTLVPYASETRLIPVIDPRLPGLLERLGKDTGGATVIVSGRGVNELQGLLGPIRLPILGTHGFEFRASPEAAIELESTASDTRDMLDGLDRLYTQSSAWAQKHRGISAERKALTVVVHFHDAPEMADLAYRFAREACDGNPGFALQAGRGVAEFRPANADKGSAIKRLMDKPPFSGRRPIFIGDDLADEAGFQVVNSLGGISIKVGPGESAAPFSLATSQDVLAYLGSISMQL
ncbi:MAG: hypothetical protein H6R00_467 [Proteobacteria bacterium]|nr:hypothetical protein [Pseudomonadota bacterium]